MPSIRTIQEKQKQPKSFRDEAIYENAHSNIDVPGNVLIENCFRTASLKLRQQYGFQIVSSSKDSTSFVVPSLSHSIARTAFRYSCFSIAHKVFLDKLFAIDLDYFSRLSQCTQDWESNRILSEREQSAIIMGCKALSLLTTTSDWYPGVYKCFQSIIYTKLFQNIIPNFNCSLKTILKYLKKSKILEMLKPRTDNSESLNDLSFSNTPISENSFEENTTTEMVPSLRPVIEQIRSVICSLMMDVEATHDFALLCDVFKHLLSPNEMNNALRESDCFSITPYLFFETSKGIQFYSKMLSNDPQNPQLLRILEILHNRRRNMESNSPFSGVLYLKLLSANISQSGLKYGLITKLKAKRSKLIKKKTKRNRERSSRSSFDYPSFNASVFHLCCHVRLSGSSNKATSFYLKRKTRYGMQIGTKYRWDLPMAILMPQSNGSFNRISSHINDKTEHNGHTSSNELSAIPLIFSVYGKGSLVNKCFGKVAFSNYSHEYLTNCVSLQQKKNGIPIEGSEISFSTQFYPFPEDIFNDKLPLVYSALLDFFFAHNFSQVLLIKNNNTVYRDLFDLTKESMKVLSAFRERFLFPENLVHICRLETYAKVFCSVVYIGEISFVRSIVINLQNTKETMKPNELDMYNQVVIKLKSAVEIWLSNFTFLSLSSNECEDLVHLYVALSSRPNRELSKELRLIYRNAFSIFLFGCEYSDIGTEFSHIKTLNILELQQIISKINQFLPMISVKVSGIVDTKKWGNKYTIKLLKNFLPICLSRYKTISSSGEVIYDKSCARDSVDLFKSISNLFSVMMSDSSQPLSEIPFGSLFEPYVLEWIDQCSEKYLAWAKTLSSTLKWKYTIVEKSLLTEAILSSISPCFVFLNSFMWIGSLNSAFAAHKRIIIHIATVLNNHIAFLKGRAKIISEGIIQEKRPNVFSFDVVIDRENRKLRTMNPNELEEVEHEVFHTWKKIRLSIVDLSVCSNACQNIINRSKESLTAIILENTGNNENSVRQSESLEKLNKEIENGSFSVDTATNENISPILLIPARVALSEVIRLFAGFARKSITEVLALRIGAIVVKRKKEFTLFRKNKQTHSAIEICNLPKKSNLSVSGEMIARYVNALINEIRISRSISDFILFELLESLWDVTVESFESYLLPSPSPLLSKDQLETLDNIIIDFINNSFLSPPFTVATNTNSTIQARAEHCSLLCQFSRMSTAKMIERCKQREETVEITEEERKSIISVLSVRSSEGDKSASKFLSTMKAKPPKKKRIRVFRK